MKTLIIWSLESSEAVKAVIKESYKQSRHEDDLNQPLSVQSWGRDGDKRRFWLIEGQDDTHFRLYRESNPALKHNTWRSIAGTIDEVREVADKLGEENTQASRRLRERIMAAIPRFEASEEVGNAHSYALGYRPLMRLQKRKRRDYRLARKAQFTRPEPGFSLYEGRTRGKRIRYTYSDEEGAGSEDISARRSNRQSGISTPAEPAGPTYTASGRQVRSRYGGAYGETMLTGHGETAEVNGGSGMDVADDEDEEPFSRGRAQRPYQTNGVKSKVRDRDNGDGAGSSEDADDLSDVTSSGHEWNGENDDDPEDEFEEEEDEEDVEMSDKGSSQENLDHTDAQNSLVVSLRYAKVGSSPAPPDVPAKEGRAGGVEAPESVIAITTDAEMQGSLAFTTSSVAPRHTDHPQRAPQQAREQPPASTYQSVSAACERPRNSLHHFPPRPSLPAAEPSAAANPHTTDFNSQTPSQAPILNPPIAPPSV